MRNLSQKNTNISAQGVRILDPISVLEASLNPTMSFKTRKRDLTMKILPKKALKLTDAEKKNFRKFCE